MLKEFKEFTVKGNVIDLAIGVIIGGAFGRIVTSLVNDVLMPSIGLLLGRFDFSTLSITVGSASIKYGLFIQSVVDFLIVSFTIFLVVQQIHRLRKPPHLGPPTASIPPDTQLLTEIRDILKK